MNEIEASPNNSPVKVCLKCGNPEIVKDVPNPLCAECRNAAIKFPIPVWVKIFGGAIVLLVIFGLINLPASLALALNIERGIAAGKQYKFATANKYFSAAVRMDSTNTEANEHLIIAAYYNADMYAFIQSINRIADKTFEEDELLDKVNMLAGKANYYFASDSFYTVEQQYASTNEIPDSVYCRFINNDDNVYEKTLFASKLFDNKMYKSCDSVCHIILDKDDENFSALALMGSTKRFENQADSALHYCDRMLAMNNELYYASCLKARALLKLKRNQEALQLVTACKNADSTDAYTLATLALVYHFNKQYQQRDALLQHAERQMNDSASAQIFQYVHDVINNKETL
jgi:hypothetical protein